MSTGVDQDDLERRLVELGRRIDAPEPPPELVQRVLADVGGEHRRRQRTVRRRLAAAVILAVVIALGLTPPVRAAVSDLLRLGGVLIETRQPVATPAATPTAGASVTLERARQQVDFELAVPADLGRPDRITVTDDRRVVTMQWDSSSGVISWDQFDGRLSPVFLKQAWNAVEPVQVDGADGYWVSEPHPLIYIDADGREHTAEARLAGPTLVYLRGAVTIRLEGAVSKAGAVGIAESAR